MRLDIHTHSRYSDGLNTPKEMVNHAKAIGLDGISITDHNEIRGSLKAMEFNSENFTVIPGIEVSSADGHILALGVTEIIEKGMSAEETIEKIHALGGIAIAVHPYDILRHGVGDLLYKLKFDAIEVYNGRTLSNRKNPERVADELKIPKTGGSDAHSLDELGVVSIIVEDDPIESILKGDIEIIVNSNKLRILLNYLRRKMTGFI